MVCAGRQLILESLMLGFDGVPFRSRLEAACAGGFDGIGLNVVEYARLREGGLSDGDMATMLDDHGLTIMELEALHRWGRVREPDKRAPEFEALLEHVAGTFEVPHSVVIGYYDGTFDEAVEQFARLCDRVAHTGLGIALEFLPFTQVATVADAVALVAAAGRANGGLCVDIWHHTRGGLDWAAIEGLAGQPILNVQFNDGPATPSIDDYYTETMAHRLLPGEGEFEIDRFLDVMAVVAPDAPISVEVLSEELARLPAVDIGRNVGVATRSCLERWAAKTARDC